MKKLKKKLLLLAAVISILVTTSVILMMSRSGREQSSDQIIPNPADETTENTSNPPVTYASSQTEDKAETVYVKADAGGNPKKITVEAILKNPGDGNPIPDRSSLSDIRNTEGDEEYTQKEDGTILWDNHGEDIHYKGTSIDTPPVSMSIHYYLDEQEISPDDLAGKNGHLRIRFDYENHTAPAPDGLPVPFAAITAVFLPSDVFYNIDVENGKLISVSDQNMVIGTAYPGIAEALKLAEYEPMEEIEIPEYVEITADVVDFELNFTATVITSGLLEDLKTDDLDEIEELTDDMKELEDAADELTDGTNELYDGVFEFKDGIKEYVDGTNAVNEGIEAVYEGLDMLYEQKLPMREGAAALQTGLEALEAAVADMQAQLEALQGSIPASADAENASADPEMAPALQETDSSLSDMAAALDLLKTSISQLAEGSRQMSEGIHAYTHGVTELYLGMVDLKDGSQELTDAGKELNDAAAELLDGVLDFRDGVTEFNEEGIQSLTDLAGDNLKNLISRIRTLKEQDKNYQNFSGIQEGQTGSVRFIIETDAIE